MADGSRCDAASDEFVTLYVADRDEGRIRDEADYLRLYPGCEDVISREWRRLEALLAGDEPPPEAAAPARAPSRPAELGRYRIERELGRGAQGTVFLALDTNVGRRVALKVLKTSWSGSEAMVRRFELEAQALARLDHPGIVAIHDAGSAHGLEYFAMRYVEGRTLARELADRALGKDTPPASRRLDAPLRRDHREVRASAARRARERARPPRRQAGEHHDHRGRRAGAARLRPRPVPRLGGRQAHRHGGHPRDAGIHGARADRRRPRAHRPPHRRLRARGDAAGPRRGSERRRAAELTRPRRRARDGDRPGPRPQVRHGRRVRGRPRARAPRRARRGAAGRAPPQARDLDAAARRRQPPSRSSPPLALVAGLVALALKNAEIEAAARDLAAREAGGRRRRAESRRALRRVPAPRRPAPRRRSRAARARALAAATRRGRPRWSAGLRTRATCWRGSPDTEPRSRNCARAGRGPPSREPGLDPVVDELLHAERVLGAARAEVAGPATASERRTRVDLVAKKAADRVAALEAAAASRPSWKFAGAPDQWLHDNLSRLVARLEALDAPSAYGATRASVRKRGELARAVEQQSLIDAGGGVARGDRCDREPGDRSRLRRAEDRRRSSASFRSAAIRSRGSGSSRTC